MEAYYEISISKTDSTIVSALTSQTSQTITVDTVEYNCSLTSLHYLKKVYQPGELQLKLQITAQEENKELPSLEALFSLFADCYIDVNKRETASSTDGTDITVAKKYYIFDINPEYRKGSTKTLYIEILAYSPDKFLTLDRYCKAYTGKKLFQDIITNGLTVFKKVPTDAIPKATNYLHQLRYENETKEYIHPYLVQYNESFYDFLVRTMNRCGEFLYYEEEELCIGWKRSEAVTIPNYASITYAKSVTSACSHRSFYNNYTQTENIQSYTDTAPSAEEQMLPLNQEMATDAYLTPLPDKSQYTKWESFAGWPDKFWVGKSSEIFSKRTLLDMVTTSTISSAIAIGSAANKSKIVNDGYEKTNFTKPEKDTTYFDERMNSAEKKIYPYNTSAEEKEGLRTFDITFYEKIRIGEEAVENQRIRVDLDTNFYPLYLGSIISLDESNSQKYIVVRIEGDLRTTKIEAVPYYDPEKKLAYPPTTKEPLIRTSKAQTAFIVDNVDPLKMNRVRIRYPWQSPAGGNSSTLQTDTNTEDASPWIRMVMPMASNGVGFNFLPQKGDEALIDYEDGNIEKPYVVGMLYSKNRPPQSPHLRTGQRIISSANGHSIRFTDNTNADDAWIKELSPAWALVRSFIPGIGLDTKNEDLLKASGGIELTDTYGLYSISMSSDSRKINISSPFGSVGINAYTGITVTAPNGDIKIVGKNVDIVAGNNLTLTSGANIKNYIPRNKKEWLAQILQAETYLVGLVQPINLALVRTVLETFLRPIGGTLLIKSCRYLRLEAGRGEAAVLNTQWRKQIGYKRSFPLWLANTVGTPYNSATIDKDSWGMIMYNQLNMAEMFIQALFVEYKDRGEFIVENMRIYENARQICSVYITQIYNDILNCKSLYDEAQDLSKKYENLSDTTKWKEAKKMLTTSSWMTVDKYRKDLFESVQKAHKEKCWERVIKNLQINKKPYKELNSLLEPKKVDIHVMCSRAYGLGRTDNAWFVHFTEAYNAEINKQDHRRIIYELFSGLFNTVVGKSPLTNISYAVPLEAAPYDSDARWADWINSINVTAVDEGATVQDSFLKSVGKTFLFSTVALNPIDENAWDQADHGQILFSNQKGKTYCFDDETIKLYNRSRVAVLEKGKIQALLRNIN